MAEPKSLQPVFLQSCDFTTLPHAGECDGYFQSREVRVCNQDANWQVDNGNIARLERNTSPCGLEQRAEARFNQALKAVGKVRWARAGASCGSEKWI